MPSAMVRLWPLGTVVSREPEVECIALVGRCSSNKSSASSKEKADVGLLMALPDPRSNIQLQVCVLHARRRNHKPVDQDTGALRRRPSPPVDHVATVLGAN